MLHVFAVGAVGGLACGVVKHMWFPGSTKSGPAAQEVTEIVAADTGSNSRWNILKDIRLATAGPQLACACAATAAAAFLVVRQQRKSRSGRRSKANRDRKDGRIPLQDLIRFKERQWFIEELENARDADPNAMLRLAKMYLHGQGCQRNIAMAQEWVRKARNMGVAASLDELFATDDPNPRGKLRALAAQEEKRRALRRSSNAAHQQQQRPVQYSHTAAA